MLRSNLGRTIVTTPTALLMCVLISGCTLMNPHVRWERPENLAVNPKPADQPTSLPEAIAYAHRAEDAYRDALGDQALLTNSLALPLIALAGVGIGFGVASTANFAKDVVLGTSLAGASGLALGYWYSSEPRQRVYIAGVKAMICAVTAVEPLHLGDVKLRRDLRNMNDATGEVGAKSAVVRQAIAELVAETRTDTPLVARARAALQAAAAGVTQADETYGAGIKLQLAVARAGPALENAVDRISALVDDAILSTQPDLSQLPGIIGGLAGSAGQFVQLPEPGAFPLVERPTAGLRELDLDPALENALRAAVDDLNAAVAGLDSASRRVAAVVNAVNQEQSFEALKNCGVDIEAPATALKTQPSGIIEFKEGVASNRGFTISGGEHPYFAQLLDEQDGLRVKQPVAFGPAVTVSINTDVPPNTYNVQISDVRANSLIVPITVVPEIAPGGRTDTTKTGKNGGNSQVAEMQQLLAALGFEPGAIDGKRGDDTNKALAAYLAAIQIDKVAADLSTTEFGGLFLANTSGIDGSEKTADRVRDAAIENLLKKLGHNPGTPDGVFDDQTKAAIKAANNNTPFTADTPDERTALLKMLRAQEAAAGGG